MLLAGPTRGFNRSIALLLTIGLLAINPDAVGAQPGTVRAQPGDPRSVPPTEEAEGSGEAGHGSVSFRLGYYNNDDNGNGNPFLDEELTVIEPIVYFDYNLTDKLGVWIQATYDNVSSASIDRLSRFPQQSGASGDYYLGLDAGFRYQSRPDLRFGSFIHLSTEYDYTSIGIGGDISKDLADNNATVKFSLNTFFDQIDVIRFDGTEPGDDDRFTLTASASLYQILNPKTHAEIGASLTYQTGFLETSFNAVVVEDPSLPPNPNLENMARGREITEELPDSRIRGAVFGRVRRFLGERTSVELGGRLYADSWGITSIAIEPRFYVWLVPEKLNLRLRYRYYTQTAADQFEDRFFTEEKERTQDSDLGDFNSQSLGFKLNWQMSPTWKLDVTTDFTDRSDGIDQIFGSIGITHVF